MVKRLTRSITGRNHTVYCDNFFTSVPSFKDLLKGKIYACGTYNRTIPENVILSGLCDLRVSSTSSQRMSKLSFCHIHAKNLSINLCCRLWRLIISYKGEISHLPKVVCTAPVHGAHCYGC